MSLFSDYYKERDGKFVIETGDGFIVYKMFKEECLISELFVRPQVRLNGIGSYLADKVAKVAKDAGCRFLTATVDPKALNARESTLAILHYGFRILRTEPNMICFIKEL